MKKWQCDLCGKDAKPGEGGYAYAIKLYEKSLQVDISFWLDGWQLDLCEYCQDNALKEVLDE